MSIKLEYILRRNKTNLKTFINKNKLTSYQKLIEYCDYRGFIPCDEQSFAEVTAEPEESNVKQKVRRQTSKAQKPKKTRNRRKKQPSPSKLPDSTD